MFTDGSGSDNIFTVATSQNNGADWDTDFIIQQNGRVGIGTTSTGVYKLYVDGSAFSTGNWESSDKNFKKNIKNIGNSIELIKQLNGVSYNWKIQEYAEKGFPEGKHYGIIAQEIEKVLPDMVNTGPANEKAVAYSELIPILIEAIKEQQTEIDVLYELIQEIQKQTNHNNN